jgi:hypothetical protein
MARRSITLCVKKLNDDSLAIEPELDIREEKEDSEFKPDSNEDEAS